MTNVRRAKPRREVPRGELKKPRSVRFVTVMAFVLPGSGQVFNGAPTRGVIMQFGMVFGAFITYMLTTPDISPLGRMAGGLLVWVFSIVDAHGIATRRVHAWERIQAEQREKAKTSGSGRPAGKKRRGSAVSHEGCRHLFGSRARREWRDAPRVSGSGHRRPSAARAAPRLTGSGLRRRGAKPRSA